MITQKQLKSLLSYNQRTGKFTWKVSLCNRVPVGNVAGSKQKNKYVKIMIARKSYQAHRLAWLYVKGKWPNGEIDHKDTVKHHNWFSNLHDVNSSGNKQNKRKAYSNSQTGFLGVTFNKCRRKFQARIKTDSKTKSLGYFDTAELANVAYITAKRELHKTCTI